MIERLAEYLRYMAACHRAYKEHRDRHAAVTYFGLTRHQVPFLTVLIGTRRDAWVITQLAMEHRLTAGTWKDVVSR